MKIRILTSCTGAKLHSPENQLTQMDFRLIHDYQAFARLEDRLSNYRAPAVEMYTGQQHARLMNGVRYFQDRCPEAEVDIWIVSAGYGLIHGSKPIVPYECSFQSMKTDELRTWANRLQIPQDARKLFSQDADLIVVILGEKNLRSLDLDEGASLEVPTV